MKKLFSLLLAVVMIAVLCAGCADGGAVTPDDSSSTPASQSESPVTENVTPADTGPEVVTGFDVASAAQYDHAGEFHEGFAKVGRLNENGEMKYSFIDTAGKTISGEYDIAGDFSDGMAAVANYTDTGRIYGYIDTTGAEAIPLSIEIEGNEFECLPFYDGLAVVEMPTEEYWDYGYMMTYLIDKTGKRVTDYAEIHEVGYGGWEGDPRLLNLAPSDPASQSYGWDNVAWARYHDKFPVKIFDPAQGMTLTIDKDLSVIERTPGRIYYALDQGNVVQDDNGFHFVTSDGVTVIENASWISTYSGSDLLEVTIDDGIVLYDQQGNALTGPCVSISKWANGFILETEDEENYTVTDSSMNVLWTTRCDWLYHPANHYYVDGKMQVSYEPLMLMTNDMETDEGYYLSQESLLQPETGETVIICMDGERASYLFDDFYVLNGDYSSTIVNITDHGHFPQDMFYNMHAYRNDEDKNMVSFYMDQDGQPIYMTAEMVLADGVFPQFTNLTAQDENGGYANEVVEMQSSDDYSIWASYDVSTLVALKKGEEILGEYVATSLPYHSMRKDGSTFIYDEYRVTDICVMDMNDTPLSETYENMGNYSEGYISYCQDGKWGFLKAIG